MTTRRLAAIDCGTNTIRLLVADLETDAGVLTEVVRTMRVVRLGEGVDATGLLRPEAVARALAACREYAAVAADHDAPIVRFGATSALRDAGPSGDAFRAAAAEVTGCRVELVGGDDEARLSFLGAVRALPDLAADATVLVVDVGGGSTELVLGRPADDPRATAVRSMDVGAVRLTERHLHDDPPTADQVAAAAADVDAAIAAARDGGLDPASADLVIGVAGTVTTVAGGVVGADTDDPTDLHGTRLAAADVRARCADLWSVTSDDLRTRAYVHPGRADVLAGGAIVLDRVLAASRADTMTVSVSDILDGLVWTA